MITEHAVGGWRAITVTSDHLSLTVLPERGAEVHALVDRASGVDVLFHAPWGLAPPGAPAREAAGGHAFLERYAGGWQELFPSAEGPCTYRGHEIGYHGEVAAIPWQVVADGDRSLMCSIDCETVPFRLERRLTLADDAAQLRVDERVRNTGDEPWECTWGHHLVLGAPFVAAGARFEPAAGTIVTIPEMWEDTARLEPGQRSAWPDARLRAGGTVDLRDIPGPEIESHDDTYLTDLTAGTLRVTNPQLGRALRLDWDPAVFRWIIAWMPFGGARAMPLAGSYALGIEPWVAQRSLADAAAVGEALRIEGGATLETTLTVTMESA
jgi:galactose mutarotase-like enzyme